MSTTTYPSSYPTSYPTSDPSSHPTSFSKNKPHTSLFESLCIALTDNKSHPKNNGIKVKYIINFHKATTAIFILSLMSHYKNYSMGSYLYLALHGIYGLIWILKDSAFPDKSFENKTSIFGAIMLFFVLSGYWVLPILQISGHGINKPSSERVMFCIILLTMGIAIMIASDAQKTFTLKHKHGLINDGMFKYTRNPNYIGEIMIYSSFASATGNIISWGIILTFWITLFIPRMVAKDVSLRNKEGASEYFEQSSMFFPKIFFRSTFLHYLSWMAIFATIYFIGGMVSLGHLVKKLQHSLHS